MHHFVRYNLETGEITGHFKMLSNDILPNVLDPEEGQIEITGEQDLGTLAEFSPRQDALRGKVIDGHVQRLRREPLFDYVIELTTDLQDADEGGVAEAPADGETQIKIWAKVTSHRNGEPPRKGQRVRFRTTRGALSSRFAETHEGVATVSLRAIDETTSAIISASVNGSPPVHLNIDFIPVEEFKTLHEQTQRRTRNSS